MTAAPLAPGMSASATRGTAFFMSAVTLLVVWRVAAGVGLYWGAASLVGVAQSLLLRRTVAKAR